MNRLTEEMGRLDLQEFARCVERNDYAGAAHALENFDLRINEAEEQGHDLQAILGWRYIVQFMQSYLKENTP